MRGRNRQSGSKKERVFQNKLQTCCLPFSGTPPLSLSLSQKGFIFSDAPFVWGPRQPQLALVLVLRRQQKASVAVAVLLVIVRSLTCFSCCTAVVWSGLTAFISQVSWIHSLLPLSNCPDPSRCTITTLLFHSLGLIFIKTN